MDDAPRTATVAQDTAMFMTRSDHGHTGEFVMEEEGLWRWDGKEIEDSPAGPPGEIGPAGTFVIDVNCDFVLDEKKRPVSSCSTGLIGTHIPRPGGILRTWLLFKA